MPNVKEGAVRLLQQNLPQAAVIPRAHASGEPVGFLTLALIDTYLRAEEPRGRDALRSRRARVQDCCRGALAHPTPRGCRTGCTARGNRLMWVDAGRSICLALMLTVIHGGVATAEPRIEW